MVRKNYQNTAAKNKTQIKQQHKNDKSKNNKRIQYNNTRIVYLLTTIHNLK